jgi:[amino group carrier protein]-lysine/ornithine hydrolase
MTAAAPPGAGFAGGPVTDTYAAGLLRRMLEIPSPSYGEARLAAFLVDAMSELGFTAYVDEAGNAVGELDRGEGPTLMLLGHMDTISGQIPVSCDDGRLYGRGAVDAKGPLATMICAAARARDFTGRVVVVGAVEEETPLSRGAHAIVRTHQAPDAVVIGEPSGWSTVVLGYKGKIDLRYEVECEPTHPSSPEPKAAELVSQAWARLLDLLGPEAGHHAFDHPGATLVSISGDPSRAEAEFDVRIPPGFDVDGLVSGLREQLAAGRLEVLNTVRACRADRRNEVVRALTAGIREQRGRPVMKVKTATSDMNTLAEAWDVPMATYGPGDSRLDHSGREHIMIADYYRGIAVLSRALAELAPPRRPVPTRRFRLVDPVT